MRVVVGLLPKLYLYPQLLLVLEVQLVLLLLVIAFVLVINNKLIIQFGVARTSLRSGNWSQSIHTITFPITFKQIFCTNAVSMSDFMLFAWYSKTLSTFQVSYRHPGSNTYDCGGCQWISIGI